MRLPLRLLMSLHHILEYLIIKLLKILLLKHLDLLFYVILLILLEIDIAVGSRSLFLFDGTHLRYLVQVDFLQLVL